MVMMIIKNGDTILVEVLLVFFACFIGVIDLADLPLLHIGFLLDLNP